MIDQRAPGAAGAIQATANRLPIRDRAFAASMAVLTVHHWTDWERGLLEMQRVTRERIVNFKWDPGHEGFWLVQDYFPQILAVDRTIFLSMRAFESILGPLEVRPVLIPADCSDGFCNNPASGAGPLEQSIAFDHFGSTQS
jgi:SAM-dependent methyltransferase